MTPSTVVSLCHHFGKTHCCHLHYVYIPVSMWTYYYKDVHMYRVAQKLLVNRSNVLNTEFEMTFGTLLMHWSRHMIRT